MNAICVHHDKQGTARAVAAAAASCRASEASVCKSQARAEAHKLAEERARVLAVRQVYITQRKAVSVIEDAILARWYCPLTGTKFLSTMKSFQENASAL